MWSDYICPWCYAGLARTARLRELGVTTWIRPFELHPELPSSGVPLGSSARRWARIEVICSQDGRPFRPPGRLPNTRRLLEAAEVVRARAPAAQSSFHDRLLTAAFGEGHDLGDRSLIDSLLSDLGVDPAEVWQAVGRGEGRAAVDVSRADAFEAGVAGTPAWLLDGRSVIPGVQPPEAFDRAVSRLRARPAPQPDGPPGD